MWRSWAENFVETIAKTSSSTSSAGEVPLALFLGDVLPFLERGVEIFLLEDFWTFVVVVREERCFLVGVTGRAASSRVSVRFWVQVMGAPDWVLVQAIVGFALRKRGEKPTKERLVYGCFGCEGANWRCGRRSGGRKQGVAKVVGRIECCNQCCFVNSSR